MSFADEPVLSAAYELAGRRAMGTFIYADVAKKLGEGWNELRVREAVKELLADGYVWGAQLGAAKITQKTVDAMSDDDPPTLGSD
jgi:predicted transcriptional regulator